MAETHRPSFEPAEVTRPWIVGGAVAGFLLFAVVLMGILLAVYLDVAVKPRPLENFPEPRLQSHPQADLKAFMEAQQKKLKQSGWIDREAGIAAIPVEQAMKIIAGRGAAAYAPLADVSAGKGAKP
ncbi:MAG: hypothetical protein BGN87_20635 [Rhizobiales bacterium 65-79]|jgi:hypothetical protein|nr:hypothetical protein [Hyphomicrobiales bacterium]OJU04402.1 MAG: hypothetical protein BGN87_20635 [Rhizobiales bacterium 65-79]